MEVPMDIDENYNQTPSNTEENAGQACMVSERPFAENVLHYTIKIGKEKASAESVVNPVCALLNSGGGILVMKIEDFTKFPSPLKQIDKFWSILEDKLIPLIKPSEYNDVFDREIKSHEVFLFIKAPDHLCTVQYNLFSTYEAKALQASYDKVFKLLSKKNKSSNIPQVPIEKLPALPERFIYGEVLEFHESKKIQFKCYTSDNGPLHDKNHSQHENFRKHVSAFGNGSGGMILLGVSDKGVVIGQNMEKESEAEIERRINFSFHEMSEAWSFTPKRKVHYDIKFFPVFGMESNSVIVVYIAGMQNLGGIFAKCPKSYELSPGDEEEKICRLDFQQWKQRMLRGTQDDSKGIKEVEAKFQTLNNLKAPLLTIQGSVKRIKKTFFAVKPGCPVSPEGFEANLPETAKQVILQIREQSSRSRKRSLLVASRSWLSCVKKTEHCSKEDGVICDLLLFDQEVGGVHLFTLCNSVTDVEYRYAETTAKAIKKALVIDGGCHEKFYITCHMVPCYATTTPRLGQWSPDSRYPREYQLESSRGKLNEILKSLVIVLAQVPSVLSNKQGISFLNLLTVEQFQLLYQEVNRHRELWIKGAAGTGKTLVAAEFIRELKRRDANLRYDNILYVCENIGIRRKIRKLGICECVCRHSFMMQSFPNVKHVILDEVQNYRAEDGDWLEKARQLVRQHYREHDCSLGPDSDDNLDCSPDSDSDSDTQPNSYIDPDPESSTKFGTEQEQKSNHDSNSDSDSNSSTDIQPYCKPPTTDHIKDGPGFLWLFTDINQINHGFPTGIPHENHQQPSFYLTKVIRNSKNISSLAKTFLSEDAAREIEMGHDFDGERAVRKKYSRGQQIAALRDELCSLLEEGYSEGDIAILFGKEDCIPNDLSSQLNLTMTVGADDDDSEWVVVSSFRKYSGLERPVVILVNITASLPYRSLPNASHYCAVTRAMIKLVFLQEKRGRKRKHQTN